MWTVEMPITSWNCCKICVKYLHITLQCYFYYCRPFVQYIFAHSPWNFPQRFQHISHVPPNLMSLFISFSNPLGPIVATHMHTSLLYVISSPFLKWNSGIHANSSLHQQAMAALHAQSTASSLIEPWVRLPVLSIGSPGSLFMAVHWLSSKLLPVYQVCQEGPFERMSFFLNECLCLSPTQWCPKYWTLVSLAKTWASQT